MNLSRSFARVLSLGIFIIALSAVARGQATRTWVSGVGDDVNPCSRTAPCKTYAGAISKTADGGEIDALDPGGFGTVTIMKSITIDGSTSQTSEVLRLFWGGDRELTQLSDAKARVFLTLTFDAMRINKTPSGYRYALKSEGNEVGSVEVRTVNALDGNEVQNLRVFCAPVLNPGKVRKYRALSSPAVETLPVGGEFVFWAGKGDDPTPLTDKVTAIVQSKNTVPITLQLKE
jgi:hypothetical protein